MRASRFSSSIGCYLAAALADESVVLLSPKTQRPRDTKGAKKETIEMEKTRLNVEKK